MKVYAVFHAFKNLKFNHELGKNIELETIQLDGIYTTEEGARRKVEKIAEVGLDSYYVTQSLKGDLVELVGQEQENKFKQQGLLRQNLRLQKKPKKEIRRIIKRIKENEFLVLNFKVVKKEEK